jgi:hypothetical protein
MPLAALLLIAANVGAGCALDLLASPGGARLARVPLPADQTFALRYTHSVTLRPVESRYVVRGNHMLQTAEVFDAHGPGMATEAQPGERWETQHAADGTRFVLHMARPMPRLVIRLHALPSFALRAGAQSVDLGQWGVRSVEVRADCPPPAGASPFKGEAGKRMGPLAMARHSRLGPPVAQEQTGPRTMLGAGRGR